MKKQYIQPSLHVTQLESVTSILADSVYTGSKTGTAEVDNTTGGSEYDDSWTIR